MKELIEDLRVNADAHPLDVRLSVMIDAADAIESQAREIERLKMHLVKMERGRAGREALKAQPSGVVMTSLIEALKFYANGDHLLLADPDAWDTCSGEPFNFLHDDAGTASVEDGSIAKGALQRLNQPAIAGDETNYPSCDYCAARINYHPWHGSGMFNGVESRHIHACNDCRHKLPNSNASSAGDERAAFEAAVRKHHQGDMRHLEARTDDGYYVHHIQEIWLIWQARAALSANHSEQVRVPEGWQLAPVEPSVEVLTAMSVAMGVEPLSDGSDGGYPITGRQSTARQVYMAMLAAAPSAGSHGGDV